MLTGTASMRTIQSTAPNAIHKFLFNILPLVCLLSETPVTLYLTYHTKDKPLVAPNEYTDMIYAPASPAIPSLGG